MTITLEAGPINIDGYSVNPDVVWTLAEHLGRRTLQAARVLFPDRPKYYVTATKNLAHYAYNKATAMRLRVQGDVNRAVYYEDICDNIYSSLPDYARW